MMTASAQHKPKPKPFPSVDIKYLAGVARLRAILNETKQWYTDDELKRLLIIAANRHATAVRRGLLGVINKAREAGDSAEVIRARNLLHRYDAGILR